MSVNFQTEEDRQEVLSRAKSLQTDRKSNIQVQSTTSKHKSLVNHEHHLDHRGYVPPQPARLVRAAEVHVPCAGQIPR